MPNFLFATDVHGIEQDRVAVKTFKSAADALGPSFRIFGGDLWNFAALRRGADEDEKSIRLAEDYQAGLEFLEWYKPSVFLLGNHDQRLWDAVKRERVRKSGWLAELAGLYISEFTAFAKKLKIKVLPYDKTKGVFRWNGVAFAHGYGHGDMLTTKMADSYGNVVFGHGHKIIRETVMKGKHPVTGYQIGCLAKKNMDYVRADLHALRQQHGFAYGSATEIFTPEILNGHTTIATATKVV